MTFYSAPRAFTDFTGRMSCRLSRLIFCLAVALPLVAGGCTSFPQYIRNGLKVGPNYKHAPAPYAEHWIDDVDKRVRSEEADLSTWWTVFNDPLLGGLIVNATQQNLTLRQAGFRILEARAQLGIARGNFFPQMQDLSGSYTRFARPGATEPIYGSYWNYGFNLAWELDFWGRFRRAIISAEDALEASVFDYDDVMITLIGDVANNYIQYRTDQERIRLLKEVVQIQENVLKYISDQLTVGFRGVTNLDRAQAVSNLKQSQAAIAQLEIDMRLQQNSLCTLLGHSNGRFGRLFKCRSAEQYSHYARLCDRRHSGRLASSPARRAARRTASGGSGGTNRHCRNRFVSGLHHFRHAGRIGGAVRRFVQARGVQQQRGAIVPMEFAELRPDWSTTCAFKTHCSMNW